ncbi:MAG: cation:proton antiporter, partial [Candidatus Micrarchaeota archaeon]|nr:cation:proton antiporter [Candidatus Micrarchaeota archaeon]
MEAGLVIGLSITTILVFGLLMERVRLPMVLGVLLAGALIGPASPLKGLVLGPLDLSALVITQTDLVSFFGLLGSVLILFGIGLEFSILKLRQMGLSTLMAALIKLGVIYAIGYFVTNTLMGLPTTAAMLLGLILSFSSTPIVIKILDGQGKLRRPETEFILAVLIIEDLLAVVILGIMATSGFGDQYAMALAVLKVLVTFGFAYVALSYALKRLLALVEHSDELMVLFVVSALLVISYLCQYIGLGFSVGAFLAGS